MAKEKPFPIETNGYKLSLRAGTVMSVLFRHNCEVDYLAIDLDEYPETPEQNAVLRIFNNEDLARWMAGISLRETFRGHFKPDLPEMSGKTFRETYGWNSGVIIREAPTETEKQWFTEAMVGSMDDEWAHFTDEA